MTLTRPIPGHPGATTRRTVLQSIIAAPLLIGAAGSLASCGRSGPLGGGTAQAYPVAASTVTRAAADPAKAGFAAQATARFGSAVLRELAPEPPEKNLLISPYSIMVALGMTKLGARGETLAAMDEVLGDNAKAGPLASGLNALGQQLASYAGEREWTNGKVTIDWSEANSLWGQHDTPWEQPFLDSLARDFGAGMHQVDYKAAAEAARTAINGWTSQATKSKIPEIIEANSLNDMTRLVLVNAVHFKAPWASPFFESETKPEPFTRADGSRVDVPMMRGGAAGVESGPGMPGFVAISLAYADLKFGFTAVLPNAGQEAAVHELMSTDVSEILTGLNPMREQQNAPDPQTPVSGKVSERYPATLVMPRFSLDYGAALKPALTALGMGIAFDQTRADLSGMTTAERLFISFVAHKATMDVDEKGTEAAAATAIGAEAVSAPLKVLDVRLDRPFYVILTDQANNTPLFLGYVADPSA
ncbi:MAG: serpin family protein [Dermatophilus congolensis]|nr:serpin family protein [Dermatophilus congolensis]